RSLRARRSLGLARHPDRLHFDQTQPGAGLAAAGDPPRQRADRAVRRRAAGRCVRRRLFTDAGSRRKAAKRALQARRAPLELDGLCALEIGDLPLRELSGAYCPWAAPREWYSSSTNSATA